MFVFKLCHYWGLHLSAVNKTLKIHIYFLSDSCYTNKH